ncbi:MAG TPA: arsenite methyltransferase [Bacteroidetes bacterium]|nr:arsenite methyltransferase [Bacteroidota bacterium]
MDKTNIKDVVREKYSQIAMQNQNSGCCCGCDCSGTNSQVDYSTFSESYEHFNGYNPNADLNLGCGLPTEFAQIKVGNTVVDLGSGAGNDCFVAHSEVGEMGKVIGIDFTDQMIAKARENTEMLKLKNVEFNKGDIEEIPLSRSIADVVISNCLLNLVPNKQKAFAEIYRILKPGGHFSIGDVVLVGKLPENLRQNAELYAGCVSRTTQKNDYINTIRNARFCDISIQKEKPIEIPDLTLLSIIKKDEVADFKKSKTGIYSITIFGQKI